MYNIKEAIKRIADNEDEVYSIVCVVQSVDETERTCDVSPVNGDADIFGVRLQANISASTGLVMLPKVGSDVVVTFLNDKTGYVALYSEVEKTILKIGQKEIDFDDQGLLLKSATNNLKDLVAEFIDVVLGSNYNTAQGPTVGLLPDDILKLQTLKTKFNSLLK